MFEKVYCDVIHHDLEIMSSHRPALVVAGLIERTVFRDTVCDEITARAWKISLARSLALATEAGGNYRHCACVTRLL